MNTMLGAMFLALSLALVSSPAVADQEPEFGQHFQLESLHYVGIHDGLGGSAAIIVSDCGAEFRVMPGNYLGTRFGKVVRFDKRELFLIELWPDGKGGWLEKERRLHLEPRRSYSPGKTWGPPRPKQH